MIYLDHAATSWPKPPEVIRCMADYLERAGGNPGRSGHRLSVAAARIVYDAREAIAEFFGLADPLRVLFTTNATHGVNLALRGLLRPGDRVVTTSVEHNAVMRPLRALEREGVHVTVVPCRPDGTLDLTAMAAALTPGIRLVTMTHANNVTGALLPVAGVAALAHAAGALLLVDVAQAAGAYPIDMTAAGIDLLAFTGHKGLQGPPGTGGLLLGDRVDPQALEPLMRGGTGSRSESEEQPDDLPDRYESGTPNGVGIAGLAAGIRCVTEQGVAAIREHEVALTARLLDGLGSISGLTTYGPTARERTACMSVRVAGKRVSEVGLRLDEEYGILTRVGLHCAPAAHRTIGTFPEGTVRLALGVSNTAADVDAVLQALEEIART